MMSSAFRKFQGFALGAIIGSPITSSSVDEEKGNQITKDDVAQDTNGAPVEKKSPLGYDVTAFSTFYLIVQGVLGTGIFATPATILESMGSIGSTYVIWTVGFIVVLLQVFMYVEYSSYFRHRSGAEVVYLEQAYPKPRFMIPVLYAAISVCLSFATSSASAFATYIFKASGRDATAWERRGLGVLSLVLAAAITATNTKFAIKLNNLIGFVKVVFILFVALSGFATLAGSTQTPKAAAHAVFKDAWKGTTTDGNSISNAILKVIFSFEGCNYAFGVVAESHPKNTIRTYSILIPFTMFFIYILYILAITAYYAGVADITEIKESGNLIAAVYFEKIFGTNSAVTAMSAFVAISAFGHLLTVYISHSRTLRECGRQGVLPYPRIWTSVKPLGTPLFPILVTFIVNLIVLLAPPPGDAYNFVVDLGSYSTYIFNAMLSFGLFKLRRHRSKIGLGYQEFHIPAPLLALLFLFSLFVIAMAFVPPEGTLIGSDVSFFYATYPITTIGIFLFCIGYYFVWEYVLPKIGKYRHRLSKFELAKGENGHKVIKVALSDLEEWDREHKDQDQDQETSAGPEQDIDGIYKNDSVQITSTSASGKD
ncbi:hypothetical protein FOA43_002409 [Brettanomyces nanus]|uniref:Amino acid transporter n=1 Tax=Eeniella nana TaxID=13502 RepID=A0A875S5N7_EENNA|nr:uncharacterized protein FOA43_002409 [Brettanomyces nanus]QPG75069.1 hypothetical protein FOA43_002409 [Brettanomyces nanus]